MFVDVRDRSGLVQLRFDPNVGDGAAFRLAKQLRAEWVIGVGVALSSTRPCHVEWREELCCA